MVRSRSPMRESRRVALDEDAADALGAGAVAHAAVDEIETRRARAGDPALLAAERPALRRLVGAGDEIGGGGARLGLGDGDGRLLAVLQHPREVATLLRLGAVGGERAHHAEAAFDDDPGGDAAGARDLLDHEEHVEHRAAGAAVRLGDGEPHEARADQVLHVVPGIGLLRVPARRPLAEDPVGQLARPRAAGPAAPQSARSPSDVDGLTERREGRLERGLGQRRVGVDGVDRSPRAWPRASARPRTRGSARWPRARRCARRGSRRCALSATTLRKPSVSPSATALPFAVNGKRPDAHLAAIALGRRLGEADGRDLGAAIRAGRDIAVVDRTRGLARDRLGGHHALGHGLVGEELVGPPCRRWRRSPSPTSRMVGATVTKPRSIATPSASSPRPLVRAARPTAISTWSARSVSVLPSASTSTATPAAPGSPTFTVTPVRMVMPRRPKSRAIWVDASSSSMGSTRGSASSTVTWVPYAA